MLVEEAGFSPLLALCMWAAKCCGNVFHDPNLQQQEEMVWSVSTTRPLGFLGERKWCRNESEAYLQAPQGGLGPFEGMPDLGFLYHLEDGVMDVDTGWEFIMDVDSF